MTSRTECAAPTTPTAPLSGRTPRAGNWTPDRSQACTSPPPVTPVAGGGPKDRAVEPTPVVPALAASPHVPPGVAATPPQPPLGSGGCGGTKTRPVSDSQGGGDEGTGRPARRHPQRRSIVICQSCDKRRANKGRGWCSACHARWLRADKPAGGPPPPQPRSAAPLIAMKAAAKQGRLEDYAELRDPHGMHRLTIAQAAERLGVCRRTADRYEAELRKAVASC